MTLIAVATPSVEALSNTNIINPQVNDALTWDGTEWVNQVNGSGTVSSVAMTGDNIVFNSAVTGSPITGSGTLVPSLKTQSANTVLSGPSSGPSSPPTFRGLVVQDFVSPNISQWTNNAGYLTAATGVSSIAGTAAQILANGTSGSAQVGAVTLTFPTNLVLNNAGAAFITSGENGSTFNIAGLDDIQGGVNFITVTSGNPATCTLQDISSLTLIDNTPATPSSDRLGFYSKDTQSFSLAAQIDSTGQVLSLLEDQITVCRNQSGDTITKGQVVYVLSTGGTTPNIAPARADNVNTMPAFGIALEDISSSAYGRILNKGIFTGVDTSLLGLGAPIYVSASAAGGIATGLPAIGNIRQAIGIILSLDVNGTVLIDFSAAVYTGLTLTGTDGDILSFDSASTPVFAGVTMGTAAKTISLKQGANGKTGTVTLNGATPVTVNNTSITANSGIIFTLKTVGGTVGAYPAIQTITPNTGFTVAGVALDTSVYNYHIIESIA